MPAVTLDETNVAESNQGKLHCPHLQEKSDEKPQIEEKKEKEIKEQATQSNETGGKYNSFTSINEIFYSLNIPFKNLLNSCLVSCSSYST